MRDCFDPAARSRVMRRVRSRDTGPELQLRRLLWRCGFRYRLHASDLPGRPDIVFRSRKLAVFVHGCFWHGHACGRGARLPRTNSAYWAAKIARNRSRDAEVAGLLAAMEWRVVVVWECQLRQVKDALPDALAQALHAA